MTNYPREALLVKCPSWYNRYWTKALAEIVNCTKSRLELRHVDGDYYGVVFAAKELTPLTPSAKNFLESYANDAGMWSYTSR
jgi:hypothetical protein